MQENMERVPRVITLVFAVIALVLLAADEGTESIEVSLPGMSKFTYLTKSECFVDIEGLKFYLDSLSVVVGYSIFHAIVCVVNLLTTKSLMCSKAKAWFTFIADQAIAYLLASAAAVSTGIAYLSKHGAPKVGWNEVCTEFNHLCKVHVISLINAYLAALAIFASAAISAYHVFGLYAPVMPDRETQRELDI
ncbi:hypothetical protein O6H91_18G029300 [Diphasiastrum complanatum]|uniref:Uncharacterized protein n=1 Tax=Diphasiastrum complanatum TaxID=34168 RepID=A0ACC2AZB4_DIPCM|nr:hypothetical protein O6H91_Y018100 [Diphasiastrum complanatum]KAJ7522850.1 hypothetical protein O6H91_18G029300 [Diphasiastrum complanatum]